MKIREFILAMIFSAALTASAFAAEAVIRQPLSNDGSTPGAHTATVTDSGTRTALDVNVASGTVTVDSVTIDTIEVNTEPLTTVSQPNALTLSAGATGTIACGASSNSYVLAVASTSGATGNPFYSYTGNATGNPRMILFPNEKFVSPEGLKITVNTIYIYNGMSASATFYLECWR
jgi:hypothetical protein